MFTCSELRMYMCSSDEKFGCILQTSTFVCIIGWLAGGLIFETGCVICVKFSDQARVAAQATGIHLCLSPHPRDCKHAPARPTFMSWLCGIKLESSCLQGSKSTFHFPQCNQQVPSCSFWQHCSTRTCIIPIKLSIYLLDI